MIFLKRLPISVQKRTEYLCAKLVGYVQIDLCGVAADKGVENDGSDGKQHDINTVFQNVPPLSGDNVVDQTLAQQGGGESQPRGQQTEKREKQNGFSVGAGMMVDPTGLSNNLPHRAVMQSMMQFLKEFHGGISFSYSSSEDAVWLISRVSSSAVSSASSMGLRPLL